VTVNELITQLDMLPADAQVLLSTEDNEYFPAANVRLSESAMQVVVEV
jgi:hypothetical protein